jgi:hypothetical protein
MSPAREQQCSSLLAQAWEASMACIVFLSDIHLSPTHGFFLENWCVARGFADAAACHDSDCEQTDTEENLV